MAKKDTKKEKIPWRQRIKALRLVLYWTYKASPKLAVLILVLVFMGAFLPIVIPYLF